MPQDQKAVKTKDHNKFNIKSDDNPRPNLLIPHEIRINNKLKPGGGGGAERGTCSAGKPKKNKKKTQKKTKKNPGD